MLSTWSLGNTKKKGKWYLNQCPVDYVSSLVRRWSEEKEWILIQPLSLSYLQLSDPQQSLSFSPGIIPAANLFQKWMGKYGKGLCLSMMKMNNPAVGNQYLMPKETSENPPHHCYFPKLSLKLTSAKIQQTGDNWCAAYYTNCNHPLVTWCSLTSVCRSHLLSVLIRWLARRGRDCHSTWFSKPLASHFHPNITLPYGTCMAKWHRFKCRDDS